MKPITVINKYQNKEVYDLCCSESIFYAANEYYSLGLNEPGLKISAGFCGGNLNEDTCGLLTSSIAILSIIYTDGVSHNSPALKYHVKEFTKIFNDHFKSQNCYVLKQNYRDEFKGCRSIIIETFCMLCEYIDANKI